MPTTDYDGYRRPSSPGPRGVRPGKWRETEKLRGTVTEKSGPVTVTESPTSSTNHLGTK